MDRSIWTDRSAPIDKTHARSGFEGVVYVADEVAEVAAAVEQGDHGVAGGEFGGGGVGVDGGVPLGVESVEGGVGGGHFGVEIGLGRDEVFAELGFVFANLFGGAHLFELHVELEGFFEEVFGDDLFLGGTG